VEAGNTHLNSKRHPRRPVTSFPTRAGLCSAPRVGLPVALLTGTGQRETARRFLSPLLFLAGRPVIVKKSVSLVWANSRRDLVYAPVRPPSRREAYQHQATPPNRTAPRTRRPALLNRQARRSGTAARLGLKSRSTRRLTRLLLLCKRKVSVLYGQTVCLDLGNAQYVPSNMVTKRTHLLESISAKTAFAMNRSGVSTSFNALTKCMSRGVLGVASPPPPSPSSSEDIVCSSSCFGKHDINTGSKSINE
jgi:hypothetical protein